MNIYRKTICKLYPVATVTKSDDRQRFVLIVISSLFEEKTLFITNTRKRKEKMIKLNNVEKIIDIIISATKLCLTLGALGMLYTYKP